MFDHKRIELLTQEALESLHDKDSRFVYAAFKALDDAFLEEFPGRTYAFSGEALYVRMKMIAAFIEYDIVVPNLEGIYSNLGYLHDLLEFARHQNYPGKLMSSIRWCVKNAEKRVDDLMEEHLHPDPALYNTDYVDGLPANHDPQRIKSKSHTAEKCLLCRLRSDLRKGSHLAPNTLIQQFFSVDGTSTRGKEITREMTAAELKEERFWGNAVLPEQIEETFGEKIPDEEIMEIKPNPLTRDFFFCDHCEKRFGYIENAYGDYLHGRVKKVDPAVSYLFWLSVFWRLSVADMCVRLNEMDEERMRDILDCHLPTSTKDIKALTASEVMDGFKYCLYHCDNIKGELTGLVGNHASRPPYRLLVGNYVIVMYPASYDDGTPRPYNDYSRPEQIVEEPFLSYWKHKRSILDEIYSIEDTDLNDESANITDVVKGNNAWEVRDFVSRNGNKLCLDDVQRDGGKAVLRTPGAVQRMLAWTMAHRSLSISDQCKGISNDLGYTDEEAEYFYKWAAVHLGVSELKLRGMK